MSTRDISRVYGLSNPQATIYIPPHISAMGLFGPRLDISLLICIRSIWQTVTCDSWSRHERCGLYWVCLSKSGRVLFIEWPFFCSVGALMPWPLSCMWYPNQYPMWGSVEVSMCGNETVIYFSVWSQFGNSNRVPELIILWKCKHVCLFGFILYIHICG